MESHVEVKYMEAQKLGTNYGYSYRICNVCRLVERVKCMVTYIDGSVYGDSYRR